MMSKSLMLLDHCDTYVDISRNSHTKKKKKEKKAPKIKSICFFQHTNDTNTNTNTNDNITVVCESTGVQKLSSTSQSRTRRENEGNPCQKSWKSALLVLSPLHQNIPRKFRRRLLLLLLLLLSFNNWQSLSLSPPLSKSLNALPPHLSLLRRLDSKG